MKTLVILKKDYADAFECQEFIILDNSATEVTAELDEFLANSVSDEAYFGTNQYLSYLNSGDFSIQQISDKEAHFLRGLFGENFGVGVLHDVFIHKYWKE